MQTLLTQKQCAEMLVLSERTLERLRVTGAGPKFLRIRHSVRYRPADVEAWLASRVVGSTSEERSQWQT
jgi:predicted DNA-binding transcriptional regulator AlpA